MPYEYSSPVDRQADRWYQQIEDQQSIADQRWAAAHPYLSGSGASVGSGSPAPSAPGWVPQNPFAPGGSGVGGSPAAGTPAGGTDFNLNPTPHGGVGVFGAVPGALGLPNPAKDLAGRIPGLDSLNASASANIMSQLQGELPQDVLNQIQDAGARFGVASGMPGSGLAGNRTLRDVGLNSLQQQQAGLGNLNSLSAQVSGTQTVNPALQSEIAHQNAVNAAAPDPSLAGGYAKSLYDQYLASISRSGGGGTRGSARVAPPSASMTQPFYAGSGNGNRRTTNGMDGSGYDANGYPTGGYGGGTLGPQAGYGSGPTSYTDYTGFGLGQPGAFEGPGNGTMTNPNYGLGGNPFGGELDQSFWGPDTSYDPWNGEDNSLMAPGPFNGGYSLWSNP